MDMGHGAWEHDTQALMHRVFCTGLRAQGVMHGGMVPLKYETPFHLYTASEIRDTPSPPFTASKIRDTLTSPLCI